ncbi:MAG: hypothetical protein CMJ46_11385 [Planctomyces sp.]|nr:hypothetical protein [Planctomyces sp.]
MSLLVRLSLFIMTVACLVIVPHRTSCAQDQVVVHTVDGRAIKGHVDSRTNTHELVLSLALSDIQVTSHIPWKKISTMELAGTKVSLEQLQAALPAIQTDFDLRPAFGGWKADGTHIAQPIPPGDFPPAANRPPYAPLPSELTPIGYTPAPHSTTQPRVASLHVYSTVANWDEDPERDGLIVEVQPRDSNGAIVPVDGRINCELVVQRRLSLGGEYIERVGDQFIVLARWSEEIRRDQFTSNGAVVKLPYRARHPEANPNIDAEALLIARLKVPGQGVFNATGEIVRLRPYSRFRDDAQLSTGSRYLPQERTPFSDDVQFDR